MCLGQSKLKIPSLVLATTILGYALVLRFVCFSNSPLICKLSQSSDYSNCIIEKAFFSTIKQVSLTIGPIRDPSKARNYRGQQVRYRSALRCVGQYFRKIA